ncbi:MAG TPA: hypothetical protein PK228_10810 [Saprospiraceae bacterium]|nr:hypothetical protein [Saprospiraceae bacterium]
MNHKHFDQKLKTTLDNLEVPYDASSWAALEQRLNAPFIEEQPAPVDSVDKAVFHTLERLEAPYQPAHWDMLANRMTLAARTRRRVWIAKLSEAAIFLLLLVNLDGFFGSGSTKPQQPETPQEPATKRLQAAAPSEKRHHKDASSTDLASADGNLNGSENWQVNVANLLQNASIQNIEGTAAANQNGLGNDLNRDIMIESVPEEWSALADLMIIPVQQPGGASVERVNVSPYACSTVNVKAPKQHRLYAATFASYDRNNVKSEGYSTGSNGYGGGVAIGYRIGKWGMEAGLSYNRRKYEPKREIEIYDASTVNGFYGSYAKNVDADLVSVPVKITRRIAQFGQTTAHATAGVTTNIAVDKSYQYGSVYYPGQAPSGSQTPGQQPKLKQNGQGVLENGSLRGNVYASADIGVRVEQPIGRHIAAFVEPAYRMALGKKGIGPNPAKINTFSVQAGVLATL